MPSCSIKKGEDGEETVVKKCEPGDVFGWPPSRCCCTQFWQLGWEDLGRSGELALLYNCPRAASVDAKARKACVVLTLLRTILSMIFNASFSAFQEDCVLWKLDRDTFNHIVPQRKYFSDIACQLCCVINSYRGTARATIGLTPHSR